MVFGKAHQWTKPVLQFRQHHNTIATYPEGNGDDLNVGKLQSQLNSQVRTLHAFVNAYKETSFTGFNIFLARKF